MGAPERQCIGCGLRGPQAELLRLKVTSEEGTRTVVVAESGENSGRGAYLCKRQACLERALARKAFQRAFRASVEIDRERLEREMAGTKVLQKGCERR